MTIDRTEIQGRQRLPFDREAWLSGDPKRQADAMEQMVRALDDFRELIAIYFNHLMDLDDVDVRYFCAQDANGNYPLNGLRLKMTDDGLEVQEQTPIGTWNTRATLYVY